MTTMADTLFGGRYRLVQRIARGGMGEVWKASDELLQRPVAIKLLREDLVGDPGFIGRFRAEARNTAVLSHPGIAQLHDYGEQAGRAYIVMELVTGDPLSWILAREGALVPDRVLRYAGQAALALQVAHDSGVIHRDVKPANLIITPSEQVKITDFGIAKAVGDSTLTATGQVMGTAEYLSPEQAIGGAATPLSDLYALGIVLYECLAGRRPFANGNPVKIALAQVHDQPPPLPEEIPVPVRDLVSRLLSKEPTERPQGGGALAREIAHLLSDEWHLEPPDIRDNGTFIEAGSASTEPADQASEASEDTSVTTIRRPTGGFSDETLIVRGSASTIATELVEPSGGGHRRTELRTAKLPGITVRPTGRRRAPRQRAFDWEPIVALLGNKTNRVIALLVAAALFAALVGFMIGRDDSGGGTESQGVMVPRLRGASLTDASQQLTDLGLGILVTYTVTDDAEPDTVIDQRPGPDVRVDAGTVINLTVSSQSGRALGRTTETQPMPQASRYGMWRTRPKRALGAALARITGTVAGVVHISPAPYGATTGSSVVSSGGDSDVRTGKGND